jgi:hypothetical protein
MANAPSLGTGWPQYATDLGQKSRIISENQKYRDGVKAAEHNIE